MLNFLNDGKASEAIELDQKIGSNPHFKFLTVV